MQVDGFNIHYESPDFDANLAFYRDVLALPIKSQFSHEHRRGVIFAVGPTAELEFFGPPDGQQGKNCPSFVHLRIKLTVADLQAEYTRLMALGIELLEDIAEKPWGERAFTLRAPDGLTVTLCEPI